MVGVMADHVKEAFNSVSKHRGLIAATVLAVAVATTPADDLQKHNQLLPRHAETEQQALASDKIDVVQRPLPNTPSLGEIWARHGLDGEKITVALAALSPDQQQSLTQRSDALFAEKGFADVLRRMEGGKQKKLSDLVQKLSEVPEGMRIITTDYVRIDKEQNDAVWREFQEKAEPAFYRHLAATRETELRNAGFCDYAIDCLRRGLGPTNAEGISYNVDIDHLTERAGGGVMCLEKSVDPVLGAEMFPINHASNLCLIMREVHVQLKNEINGLQNIAEVPLGETRRIIMAVPEENRQLMMLHANELRAEMQPPPETSYFALGPSLLLTNRMALVKDTIISATPGQIQKYFDSDIAEDFSHTLKLWDTLAQSLQTARDNNDFKGSDVKRTLKNCDDFLKPLEKMMADARMPQGAVESLAQISTRIYTLLDAPADGGRVEKNMNGPKAERSAYAHA